MTSGAHSGCGIEESGTLVEGVCSVVAGFGRYPVAHVQDRGSGREVVAAQDPHTVPQQQRIHRSRRPPDPTRMLVRLQGRDGFHDVAVLPWRFEWSAVVIAPNRRPAGAITRVRGDGHGDSHVAAGSLGADRRWRPRRSYNHVTMPPSRSPISKPISITHTEWINPASPSAPKKRIARTPTYN